MYKCSFMFQIDSEIVSLTSASQVMQMCLDHSPHFELQGVRVPGRLPSGFEDRKVPKTLR